MMSDKAVVEHKGVVQEFDSEMIKVGFVSHSACSACHARGACSLSEVEDKFVEIANNRSDIKIGDEVNIVLQQNQGFKALWFGYVLPFLVLLFYHDIGLCHHW